MTGWNVQQGNQVLEARDAATLVAWAREGRLTTDDLIRGGGFARWTSVKDVDWLAIIFGGSTVQECPNPSCRQKLRATVEPGALFQTHHNLRYRCGKCGRQSTLIWSDLQEDAPRLQLRDSDISGIIHADVSCPSCDDSFVVEWRQGEVRDTVETNGVTRSLSRNCPSCASDLVLFLNTGYGVISCELLHPVSSVRGAQGWELQAIERLTDILSDSELRALVGDLERAIRYARKVKTEEDRPSRKDELAQALLIQHSEDLFADLNIRKKVAQCIGAPFPKRWHPGKFSAQEFVKVAAFPPELAGFPSDPTPSDYEYLEGRIDLRDLENFQEEVKQKILHVLSSDDPRAIVSLPTGAGKTRVAVQAVRDWLTERSKVASGRRRTVLWLAHTEELCEQAFSCFKEVWQSSPDVVPTHLFRFWGRYMRDLEQHGGIFKNLSSHPVILVSTPNRLDNLSGGVGGHQDLFQLLRDAVGLIVVDEAHRAAAPSYRRIFSRFSEAAHVRRLGLTATPFRMEWRLDDPEAGTRELTEIFAKLVEPSETLGSDPKSRLQEQGVLAKPRVESIVTNRRASTGSFTEGELIEVETLMSIDQRLMKQLDTPRRRYLIFDEILPLCSDPENSILYFGPSVEDAECMAYLLRDSGVPSACVSGRTKESTRRRIIRDFKEKRIRVITNCEVLTTGFDAPLVTHVLMARPTVSRVLYEQMVGRGLRGPRFGGTEFCTIVDCEDKFSGKGWPRPAYESFREIWDPVILK
jgi:DNA repair protein RadD